MELGGVERRQRLVEAVAAGGGVEERGELLGVHPLPAHAAAELCSRRENETPAARPSRKMLRNSSSATLRPRASGRARVFTEQQLHPNTRRVP